MMSNTNSTERAALETMLDQLSYAEILTGVLDRYQAVIAARKAGPLATLNIGGKPGDSLGEHWTKVEQSTDPIVPLRRHGAGGVVLSVCKVSPVTSERLRQSDVPVIGYDKVADADYVLPDFSQDQADFLMQSALELERAGVAIMLFAPEPH